MSHIATIETEIRDPGAIAAACQRIGAKALGVSTFDVFGVQTAGFGVQLNGWTFPVVCNTKTGAVSYDNYNGRWGAIAELDRFKQAYAIEKAKAEARKAGHSVREQAQADGSVKLTISLGA